MYCTSQKGSVRGSERESEVGRQSARQPAMRSSIQTARQTTCPVTAHPPGEEGQRPTAFASQRLCWRRNNYRARASGGLCCWPSNRRYSVVTGVHVVCLRFCPSPRLQYLVSILSTENSLSQKLFGLWTWSISHALNSVHSKAYNNAGVIPP